MCPHGCAPWLATVRSPALMSVWIIKGFEAWTLADLIDFPVPSPSAARADAFFARSPV
jgi:hypothetical protein